MKTIGVVTVARSDYGIYLPILRRIQQDSKLHLHLIVAGMHLSPEFGSTARAIEDDGFEIDERVEMLLSSDSAEGIAKSMGLGTIGFAQAYARFRPDILLVLGDRFEMHAAVVAAVPFNIPVAHIHGGESTEGLIDEAFRHSITKMSHLHFASTDTYARRIIQMGEEPWRVTVSGAPALDHLSTMQLLTRAEIEARFGLDLSRPPLLVTYHPETLAYQNADCDVAQLLYALEEEGLPVVFTYPNADTSGRMIVEKIQEFVSRHDWAWLVVNMGMQGYFSLMSQTAVMVGNSSSGIIEALSFKLPVVNIGDRQRGRVRGKNVIDVDSDQSAIRQAIAKARSSEFRACLTNETNPYGDGHAAGRIVDRLKQVDIDRQLIVKHFYQAEEVETNANLICRHS